MNKLIFPYISLLFFSSQSEQYVYNDSIFINSAMKLRAITKS